MVISGFESNIKPAIAGTAIIRIILNAHPSVKEKSSIEVELDNLKEKYNSLEEKFITVVKFFELNNKITSENDDLLKIDSEK